MHEAVYHAYFPWYSGFSHLYTNILHTSSYSQFTIVYDLKIAATKKQLTQIWKHKSWLSPCSIYFVMSRLGDFC